MADAHDRHEDLVDVLENWSEQQENVFRSGRRLSVIAVESNDPELVLAVMQILHATAAQSEVVATLARSLGQAEHPAPSEFLIAA